MPVYRGKYRYAREANAASGEGPCQVTFDAESCVLTPEAGAPLAFDLGDIDAFTAGELDLELAIHGGGQLRLRGFGSLFNRMSTELLAAWRDRTVRCLLLEDLEEKARFTGAAAPGAGPAARAEIRLYRSNLAVIPLGGRPLNLRLAEVDAVRFDESAYSVVLEGAAGRLAVSKLAKRTEEFEREARRAVGELRTEAATVLLKMFPFLGAEAVGRLVTTMPEGRSVRLAALAAIHPKLPGAFLDRAVDKSMKPYFDALRSRAAGNGLMAGFKFVREEEEAQPEAAGETDSEAEPEVEAEAAEPPEEPEQAEEEDSGPRVMFWFFFPIAGKNLAAWEAVTGSGRATYVFRADAREMEAAVARITRGLALVNFRREPVYLPDASLERQPRYRRYLVACRKLPELGELRACYRGRAIHTSPEAWSAQLDALLRA